MESNLILLGKKLDEIFLVVIIILTINCLFYIHGIVNTNKFRTFVMKLLYKCCSIFKIFPINKRKIIFINGHSELFNGNIKAIYDEINKNKNSYKLIIYTKKDMSDSSNKSLKRLNKNILKIYNIFTAKNIIVNDYISLFSKIKIRKDTNLIQVWHAGGAFKKFGRDSLQNIKNPSNMKNCVACHSQYDKVIVSSSEISEIYANAFGVNVKKVIPLGLARADKFYDEIAKNKIKESFLDKYPILKGKKIILYAPTFRDGQRKKFNLKLDLEYLYNNLSNEYAVITKMHPFIKNGVEVPVELCDRIMDLSYEDIDDLMISSDLLITDYSSMIFEYAIMKKPMIFFAYDLPLYDNSLRGFYYNYTEFVPGPIAVNTEEIVEIIKCNKCDLNRISEFKKKFNGYDDGEATKRIVKNILENK
ncbi:CDP-glycerol:glycerophosphate glycerophosphotransferase [Clostridium botulinum]|uniref:CDP-glycerol--glycerophosphate glycerophosphotransferase n=1 Tax=Clostridium botulinum TaxID=1491 RepID=UPI000174E24D|nr:CDP-glycerol--glycerophosphate glycerophosphotransferase [Clostridium botulinum]ACD52186.1 CDP-glycerol:glycerophosphate glycerophosphotransferase family protein [Clostridium botulinum E3 str. Alaska E43]AJF30804.1 CDP-glycerol:glycerophosphate glycerophosphotransferase [Clostridium botulinum]AJF33867.1 CDP-glycerol:glycerophosphate glycerophosphotransferase [Clostridium botulinum]MBN1036686.1 CDP-glycerol--glycerophosphate glycerophosphotransferase [Clostridium botulinum]MBY6787968.1 CDP-g